MSNQITDYVAGQFRAIASGMWPDGMAFGGEQHRDIVRIFVTGCFAMDRNKHEELNDLLLEIAEPGWTPGREWTWAASEQN